MPTKRDMLFEIDAMLGRIPVTPMVVIRGGRVIHATNDYILKSRTTQRKPVKVIRYELTDNAVSSKCAMLTNAIPVKMANCANTIHGLLSDDGTEVQSYTQDGQVIVPFSRKGKPRAKRVH